MPPKSGAAQLQVNDQRAARVEYIRTGQARPDEPAAMGRRSSGGGGRSAAHPAGCFVPYGPQMGLR